MTSSDFNSPYVDTLDTIVYIETTQDLQPEGVVFFEVLSPNSQNSTTGGTEAGPVQSVALSAPNGWSTNSTNVGGSVTLTLALPTGYSLPSDISQINWDTAYSERGRWDGGSSGLNASTGRASLGLGTAATTDATDYAQRRAFRSAVSVWSGGLQFVYLGSAPPGSAESTAVWTVERFTQNTAGAIVAIAAATGAWSNYSSLPYS